MVDERRENRRDFLEVQAHDDWNRHIQKAILLAALIILLSLGVIDAKNVEIPMLNVSGATLIGVLSLAFLYYLYVLMNAVVEMVTLRGSADNLLRARYILARENARHGVSVKSGIRAFRRAINFCRYFTVAVLLSLTAVSVVLALIAVANLVGVLTMTARNLLA